MSNLQLIAPPPDVTLAELIAEEKRAWDAEEASRHAAEQAYFAWRAANPEIKDPGKADRPAPVRKLYRYADKWRNFANDLADRICGWVPVTLAEAVMLLDWNEDWNDPGGPVNVLAFLRGLAAEDPVVALIAAEDRVRTRAVAARGRADAEFFDGRIKDDDPLYVAAEEIEDEAGKLLDQVFATAPTTLGGAIVQLDRYGGQEEVRQMVVNYLRKIAGEDHAPAAAVLPGQDEEILAKFHEWIGVCDAADAAAPAAADDAFDRMLEHADELAAAIVAMPAAGAVGRAIQFYLKEWGAGDRDGAGLRYCTLYGVLADRAACAKEILRDAVRIVPELAELCAEVLA